MGLFDGVKSAVSGAAESLGGAGFFGQAGQDLGRHFGMSDLGGSLGQAMDQKLTEQTPEEMGEDAGKAQKAMMDAAYPGTNPWERLNTGQGGSGAQVSEEDRRTVERNIDKTLSNQRAIANTNAYATVAAKAVEAYPQRSEAILNSLRTDQRVALRKEGGLKGEALPTFRANLEAAKVDLGDFEAATKRLSALKDIEKYRFDSLVALVDRDLKDRELSISFINAMSNAYSATHGNPFKMAERWLNRQQDRDADVAARYGLDWKRSFIDALDRAMGDPRSRRSLSDTPPIGIPTLQSPGIRGGRHWRIPKNTQPR